MAVSEGTKDMKSDSAPTVSHAPSASEPAAEPSSLRAFVSGVARVGQGFSVPLRHVFRKKVTEQYPKETVPLPPRSHIGRHLLNRHQENGLEKCIGCELCAWACPADAIYVQGAQNDPTHPVSVGERFAETYEINYLRCIMCGLCVEACPTRALTLTASYELAFESREEAVYTKDRLLTPPPPVGTAPGTELGR